MDKKMNNKELQSRREFLKKTAKGALPILGISLFGPTILTSCEKDEDDVSHGCNNYCTGSCSSTCAGSCESCTGSCDGTACKML